MALPAFRSWVGSLPGGEHVWTDADEFGDTFERPAHIEHDTPIDGVVHSLVEIGEQRCCSLDGDEIDEFQFGCSHLAGELAWSMRVSGERPWEQWAQHTAAFDVVELVEDVGQISVQLLGQHTVEMRCHGIPPSSPSLPPSPPPPPPSPSPPPPSFPPPSLLFPPPPPSPIERPLPPVVRAATRRQSRTGAPVVADSATAQRLVAVGGLAQSGRFAKCCAGYVRNAT